MIDTVSLYELADQRGYDVYWYTFDSPALESMSIMEGEDCAIAIDPFCLDNEADERYKMAHELGHCETGSFYNEYAACDLREKHELRADRWAIKKLLPKEELYAALRHGLARWEIAEEFTVPEKLVEKAMAYYQMLDGQRAS